MNVKLFSNETEYSRNFKFKTYSQLVLRNLLLKQRILFRNLYQTFHNLKTVGIREGFKKKSIMDNSILGGGGAAGTPGEMNQTLVVGAEAVLQNKLQNLKCEKSSESRGLAFSPSGPTTLPHFKHACKMLVACQTRKQENCLE